LEFFIICLEIFELPGTLTFFGKLFQGYTQGYTWQIFSKKNVQKSVDRDSLDGSKLLETSGGFYES
jgi:hypothetical protein